MDIVDPFESDRGLVVGEDDEALEGKVRAEAEEGEHAQG